MQTDSQIWPGQVSLIRGVHNSRIHITSISTIVPSHGEFLRSARVESDVLGNVKQYDQLSHTSGLPWLVQHLWHSLLTQLSSSVRPTASTAPGLVGNKVLEQFVLDAIAILAAEGDLVTLGLLACVIRLDVQREYPVSTKTWMLTRFELQEPTRKTCALHADGHNQKQTARQLRTWTTSVSSPAATFAAIRRADTTASSLPKQPRLAALSVCPLNRRSTPC